MPAKTSIKSKKAQPAKSSRSKKEQAFPLEKENFIIIGIGIALLIIGYILMTENSVSGFMPTVAAPILLVLGYCVVIPYGILKKPRSKAGRAENEITEAASNVKTGA